MSAIDSNEDLVQVPVVAEVTLAPLQTTGIARTGLLTSDSNRFIRYGDSALGEKILDISETQTETMINPDGIADDLWREPMTVIARSGALHGSSLSAFDQLDKAYLSKTELLTLIFETH